MTKKIERVPIDEKTHPCWSHWAANSKTCQYCRADMLCRAEKDGDL